MSRVFARFAFFPSLIWDVLVCQIIKGHNRWDQVEDGVWLGVMPQANDADDLHKLGVRGVVNTCEEAEGPTDRYGELDIQQIRIPTVDFTEPSLKDIELAIEFIDQCRSNSAAVYVHCKSGRGRSPTVVLCWLMRFHNLGPVEAHEILKQRRPQVISSLHKRNCVQEFWAELKATDAYLASVFLTQ